MTKKHDLTSDIIRYETGEMTEEEIVSFFQELVDTGMAWQLQGSYGRAAQALIDGGLVKLPCSCKRGIERDNCPSCEGTGRRIDFAAIRGRAS